jgi:purine-nucleoside phosphorylase
VDYLEHIQEAAEFISSKINQKPELAIVLGTGLGNVATQVRNSIVIDYSEIPNFAKSTVKFHSGKLICGELGNKSVLVMQGRFHFYEGYPMRQITLPIRVMFALGIRTLVLTNAVGGINRSATPGRIGLITDHINFMGTNPLIGEYNEDLGERFPDMSEPYSRKLRDVAKDVAEQNNIDLLETVYTAISGPSFETAAELKMLQKFGADTVGMSVVPEVLVARQLGMDVLGLSIITDQSLPEQMQSISHEEVKKVAERTEPDFTKLLLGTVQQMNLKG